MILIPRSSISIAVICERSGTVRDAFRGLGYDAYSFDIEPDDNDSPYHVQGDALLHDFSGFHLAICHPPCTDIAVSGSKHFASKGKDRILNSIGFALKLYHLPVPCLAMENPIGLLSNWRKPDQIIQPYWFGDPAQKSTCLWLRGIPRLEKTNVVDKGDMWYSQTGSGKKMPKWIANAGKGRAKIRSKTFPGIAWAMALQWGNYVQMVLSEEAVTVTP